MSHSWGFYYGNAGSPSKIEGAAIGRGSMTTAIAATAQAILGATSPVSAPTIIPEGLVPEGRAHERCPAGEDVYKTDKLEVTICDLQF